MAKFTAHQYEIYQLWKTIFAEDDLLSSLPRPLAVSEELQTFPGWRFRFSPYDVGSIILLSLSGEGMVEIDGEHHVLMPGTVLAARRNDSRISYCCNAVAHQDWGFIWMYFRPGFDSIIEEAVAQYGHVLHPRHPGDIEVLLRSFRGADDDALHVLSPVAAASLCFRVLAMALDQPDEAGPRQGRAATMLKEACYIIERKLRDPIDIDYVALRCGISRRHLMVTFKKGMGETVYQYWMRRKMNGVHHFLVGNAVSCKEAAQLFSISPGMTFYRLYRKYYGTAPGSTRRGRTV